MRYAVTTKALFSPAALLLLGIAFIPPARSQTAAAQASARTLPGGGASTAAGLTAGAHLRSVYAHIPLSFEPNLGQVSQPVKFLSRGSGYTLFLTGSEAVLELSKAEGERRSTHHNPISSSTYSVLRMSLLNPASKLQPTAEAPLPGKSNYFIGSDRTKWRANVPTYGKVRFHSVYPGVDLIYYGNQQKLEYDFVVSPGANPDRIGLALSGARGARVTPRGDLALRTAAGDVSWRKPFAYQVVNGQRRPIACSYDVTTSGRSTARSHASGATTAGDHVRFHLGSYDRSKSLVIDPSLVYSTYLGGNEYDDGFGIAVDSSGNAYVTGYTSSTNFPTSNAVQGSLVGNESVFVTELSAGGSSLVYSTYLGGTDGYSSGQAIAVDHLGNAYVTGVTSASDYPTQSPLQPHIGEFQFFTGFVTELAAGGSSLLYSTYLGGSNGDQGNGIAVDSLGHAYVTGYTGSPDFPLKNSLESSLLDPANTDAFVAELDKDGSSLVYSTYLGGSGSSDGGDQGNAIAVDSNGDAYVTGVTTSTDFPVHNGIQTQLQGLADAFVAELSPEGASLVYATYLGGGGDTGYGIAIDSLGDAYVTGSASPGFPTVNALQPTPGSNLDAFVAKLAPLGDHLVYSTYLGGSGVDAGYGIALDSAGNAFVTGYTNSSNFPTVHPLSGSSDFSTTFVAEVAAGGTGLVFSTYLGGSSEDIAQGIAVDAFGNTYVTGFANSFDFPTLHPFQGSLAGTQNAFVTEISGSSIVTTTTLKSSVTLPQVGQSITITARVTAASGGTPAGSVTFNDNATVLASAVPLNAGIATWTGSFSTGGVHSLTANYSGAGALSPSLGSLNLTVGFDATKTKLAASPTTVQLSQSLTLTATVTDTNGGSPTGTVTFADGGNPLTNGMVTLAGGVATWMGAFTTTGVHSLTAAYTPGAANFSASSSPAVNVTVNLDATKTALTGPLNPPHVGVNTTLTATVTATYGGTPTGSVTFTDTTTGTTLGIASLSGAGIATWTGAFATTGSHTVQAVYSGGGSFAGSTRSLTVTVHP